MGQKKQSKGPKLVKCLMGKQFTMIGAENQLEFG